MNIFKEIVSKILNAIGLAIIGMLLGAAMMMAIFWIAILMLEVFDVNYKIEFLSLCYMIALKVVIILMFISGLLGLRISDVLKPIPGLEDKP